LSTEEAVAYAQRGYGERKRPASGWASLTPAEHDVVRLVSERTRQQRHRHPAFRLTAHRANPPHPRVHQTRVHLAGAGRARSSSSRLTADAIAATGRPAVLEQRLAETTDDRSPRAST